MTSIHRYALYAGLLSGLLFYLNGAGILVGMFVSFTPLVPIFWAGFRLGGHAISHACLIALACSLLLLGPNIMASQLLLYAMPAFVLGRQLLKARLTRQGGIEWYNSGQAMVALVQYVALAFLVLGYYNAGGEGDLLLLIQSNIAQGTENMEPAVAEQFGQIAADFPYLVLGTVLWFTVLATYGAACLANFICKSYGRALRPSLAITVFDPPSVTLVFLLLSGIVGFFVPHETAYVAQTLFFVLLIPYFLLGLALLHRASLRWEGRNFWLGVIYVLMMGIQWPTLFFVGWGFIYHLRRLTETKNQNLK